MSSEATAQQLINRLHALKHKKNVDVDEETKKIILEAANVKDRSVLQQVRQCMHEKCAAEKAAHEKKMKALAANPPVAPAKLRLSDVIAARKAKLTAAN